MRFRSLLFVSAFVASGCAPEGWGPDALSRGSGNIDDETLELGRESYEMYCAGCHGVAGDGEGPAAMYLDPKPRDFRIGLIKFARVPAGQQPRDEDYIRVIHNGLAGTAMPAFRFVPEEEKQAMVTYLRTFTEKKARPGDIIAIPKDPYFEKPEWGVKKGAALYHGLAECLSCHPAYATKDAINAHRKTFDMGDTEFRASMYESEVKESDWGAPIKPPDFLVDRIKTGTDTESLVAVIAAGITNTAMPSWAATLKPKQLWGLAYYVQSLAKLRGTPEGRALKAELVAQEGSK